MAIECVADVIVDLADILDITPEPLAPLSCACPCCGERRQDILEWQEDETILCTGCQLIYDPEGTYREVRSYCP